MVSTRSPGIAAGMLLVATLFCCSIAGANSSVESFMQDRVAAIAGPGTTEVQGVNIYGKKFAAELYQSNGYRPVWGTNGAEILRKAINGLADDGLNPANYWFSALDKPVGNDADLVDRDILLSEAFIRAYYNLLVGKVDPEALDKDFNFAKSLERGDRIPQVVKLAVEHDVETAFAQARPSDKRHLWLRDALGQYRGYQDAGGWQPVPAGKTLKPGVQDPRVKWVRERLKVTGDYAGDDTASELFDEKLEAAVIRFQKRHGIDADGAVGGKTLETMNIPVADRIAQIRVNLERQRWYMHEIHDQFIVADIAGFNVYWVKDGEVYWNAKAQVGKHYTQTPIFRDEIKYLEFNPTWTIPPGIKRRSVLPGLKKDPEYLDKKGYLLLTQDGEEVDPSTIDWSGLDNIPYIVRQPAGPNNALGQVKFMFPNKHAVYLHDTNHREHFAQTSRSFSSGCIRVDQPFDLAEKLLAGQGDWDRAKIDKAIASGETTRVNLETPIRIVIAYGTAAVRDDGLVYFKEDIYQRDGKVLRALEDGFKLRSRDQ